MNNNKWLLPLYLFICSLIMLIPINKVFASDLALAYTYPDVTIPGCPYLVQIVTGKDAQGRNNLKRFYTDRVMYIKNNGSDYITMGAGTVYVSQTILGDGTTTTGNTTAAANEIQQMQLNTSTYLQGSNYDIKNTFGVVVYSMPPPPVPAEVGMSQAGINWTMPAYNNDTVTYTPYPISYYYLIEKGTSTVGSDLTITMQMNGSSSNITVDKNDLYSGTNNGTTVYWGQVNIKAPLNEGANNFVVTVTNTKTGKSITGTRTVYLNNGAVLPPSKTPSDAFGQLPQRSDYEDGIWGTIAYIMDTLLYYVKAPFNGLAYVFTNLMDTINSSFLWVGDFTKFLTTFFSFLPTPVQALITIAFTVSVAGLIIKIFRR